MNKSELKTSDCTAEFGGKERKARRALFASYTAMNECPIIVTLGLRQFRCPAPRSSLLPAPRKATAIFISHPDSPLPFILTLTVTKTGFRSPLSFALCAGALRRQETCRRLVEFVLRFYGVGSHSFGGSDHAQWRCSPLCRRRCHSLKC